MIKEYLRKSINSCSIFSHECIFFAKVYILKVGYFKERAGTLIYFLNKKTVQSFYIIYILYIVKTNNSFISTSKALAMLSRLRTVKLVSPLSIIPM